MPSDEDFLKAVKEDQTVLEDFHSNPEAVFEKYGLKETGDDKWKVTQVKHAGPNTASILGSGAVTADTIIAARECWSVCSALIESKYEREDVV